MLWFDPSIAGRRYRRAGGFGTLLAQDAWLSVLRTLETRPWFGGRLLVSRAAGVFNADGQLADEGTKKKIAGVSRGLC